MFAHQVRTRYPLLDKVVGDRYHLIGGLGKGGLGTVYLARHKHLDQLFAVKFLDLEGMGPDADAEQRANFRRDFLKEARVASLIRHDAVVRVTDFGEYAEMPFIVMEYVPGPSLLQMIASQGRLSVAEARSIARRIAQALDAFHERRLVHRDLKPANVILDPRNNGQLTLVDLGMVKDLSAPGGRSSTHPFALRGTPGYLAPEQVPAWVLSGAGISHPGEKQPVDARVDLYALGVIFYEMIAGVSPYPEGSNTQIIVWTCTRDPIPIQAVQPPIDLPAGLAALIEDTMARDPNRRPASAAAFLERLDETYAEEGAENSWPALESMLSMPPGAIPPKGSSYAAQASAAFGAQPAVDTGDQNVLLAPVSRPAVAFVEPTPHLAPFGEVNGPLLAADSIDGAAQALAGYGGDTDGAQPAVESAAAEIAEMTQLSTLSPAQDALFNSDALFPYGAVAAAAHPEPAGGGFTSPFVAAPPRAHPQRVADAVRPAMRISTQEDLDASDDTTIAFIDIDPPPLHARKGWRQRRWLIWAAPLAAALGVAAALWIGRASQTPPVAPSAHGVQAPAQRAATVSAVEATPLQIPGAEGQALPAQVISMGTAPAIPQAPQTVAAAVASAPATAAPAPAAPAPAVAPKSAARPATKKRSAQSSKRARPTSTPRSRPAQNVADEDDRATQAVQLEAYLARAEQAMRSGQYRTALDAYQVFQRRADPRTLQLHPEVQDRIRWLKQQLD